MNLFSKAILSAAIIGIALTGCGEKKDNHLKVGAIAGAETQVAEEAAKIGTYIHGLAGDVAQKKQGMIGMIASDIITCLPTAWRLVSE